MYLETKPTFATCRMCKSVSHPDLPCSLCNRNEHAHYIVYQKGSTLLHDGKPFLYFKPSALAELFQVLTKVPKSYHSKTIDNKDLPLVWINPTALVASDSDTEDHFLGIWDF